MFQPEDALEVSGTGKHVVVACVEHSAASGHPCIRYVNIFGEAVEFMKHTAKKVWHRVVKGIHYIINARDKATTGVEPYKGSQSASGCGAASFFATFAGPFIKFGVAVAVAVAVAGGSGWWPCLGELLDAPISSSGISKASRRGGGYANLS